MKAAQARLSLNLSKCYVVENHRSWLKLYLMPKSTIKCNDIGMVIPNTAADVSIFKGSLIKFIDSVF